MISIYFYKGDWVMTILAFDLGGTAVKFGVLTTAGEILEKGKFKTPDTLRK